MKKNGKNFPGKMKVASKKQEPTFTGFEIKTKEDGSIAMIFQEPVHWVGITKENAGIVADVLYKHSTGSTVTEQFENLLHAWAATQPGAGGAIAKSIITFITQLAAAEAQVISPKDNEKPSA
jgi:hypothetical protein